MKDDGTERNFEALKSIIRQTLGFDMEESADVIAVFNPELNYMLANEAACRLLGKKKHELEGMNMLHLFPNLTASDSHRHLLSALEGKKIENAFSQGSTTTKEGAKYLTDYYPLQEHKSVYAVIAHTRQLYLP
jgi:PAS domain S-box-containing protein